MPNEESIPVPGRFHNPAGYVTGASDIIDDDLDKPQSEINAAVKVFGASGDNHSAGLVPDPGSTQGTGKYLREDGLWESPPDTTYSVVSKTAAGLCPKLPNENSTNKFLRQDGTWNAFNLPYVTYSNVNGECDLCPSYAGSAIYNVFCEGLGSGGTIAIFGANSKWLAKSGAVDNDFTLALVDGIWHLTSRASYRFMLVGVHTY